MNKPQASIPVTVLSGFLGAGKTTLCMIHCLVFPLLLAALPLRKLSSGDGDSVATSTVVDTSPAVDLSHEPAPHASGQLPVIS